MLVAQNGFELSFLASLKTSRCFVSVVKAYSPRTWEPEERRSQIQA